MKKFRVLYVSCRGEFSLGIDAQTGVELFDDHTRLTRKIDLRKRKAIEDYEFMTIDATRTSSFPEVSVLHGVVLGGSPSMLSEGLPEWGGALQTFLEAVIERNIPLLGICFGHQFIGKMMGGEIVRVKKYREFGSRKVRLTHSGAEDLLFKNIPRNFKAWMSHSESVVGLAEGAKRLAFNGYGDNQAVLYKKNVYGVQFHPELEKSNLMNLYNKRVEAIAAEGLSLNKILNRYMCESGIGSKVVSNFLFKVIPGHFNNTCI